MHRIERFSGVDALARLGLGCAVAACFFHVAGAWAQSTDAKTNPGIYSCVDDKGRKLTADRPIPECASKEQRILNGDGSLRTTRPPTLTAEERAEQEARDRRLAEERMVAAEILRRDRNLLARYRDEAVHNKARASALDTVKLAMKSSELRLKELAAERKPLQEEAEFYNRKPMPAKLRTALDANDAANDAQRSAVTNQEAELVRVNRLYDVELDRLRKLWAGARPGSLGPLPTANHARPAVLTAAPVVSAPVQPLATAASR